MGQLRLHVHGMDCAEETTLIRRALSSNPAITSLDFDLINAFVHVGFDESRTTASAIFDAVRGTGLAAHESDSSTADASLHTHEHHHPRGEYSTRWAVAAGVLLIAAYLLVVLTAAAAPGTSLFLR